MAIRIRHTVNVFISDDPEGLCPLYGTQDAAKELVIVDTFDTPASGKLSIATTTTESLPLGDISDPRGLFIDADRGFNLIFNGGSEIIRVEPSGSTARAKIFLEANFTSATLENDDADNVLTAKYAVWGDVAPTP